jgi:aryl-alcohol dehydrogenase-like predicted oxidoreductase
MTRLALGTVQFGQRYGVANANDQVSPAKAATILELAARYGIDALDTAVAYGDSEACLGQIGVASWRVVSKLPPLPHDTRDVAAWVEAQVRGSLQRLRIAGLDGLLLHRPADVLGSAGQQLLDALEALKSSGWIAAAGASIYDPSELESLWPRWQPEIVQAPCNVLDRRLIRSGWLARLQRHGTRVQLRSVFLQGLLLMPAARRPPFFAHWQDLLDRWLAWCAGQGVSPLQVALTFARTLPAIERVVIGVDSLAQLEEILRAMRRCSALPPEDLFSDDRDLLEPTRWKAA